jgi:hypothetical protein
MVSHQYPKLLYVSHKRKMAEWEEAGNGTEIMG